MLTLPASPGSGVPGAALGQGGGGAAAGLEGSPPVWGRLLTGAGGAGAGLGAGAGIGTEAGAGVSSFAVSAPRTRAPPASATTPPDTRRMPGMPVASPIVMPVGAEAASAFMTAGWARAVPRWVPGARLSRPLNRCTVTVEDSAWVAPLDRVTG